MQTWEVLKSFHFSRNRVAFYFSCPLSRRGECCTPISSSITLSDLGGRITFRSSNHCTGLSCDTPLLLSFISRKRIVVLTYLFFSSLLARLDPLTREPSRPLSGPTSWGWTTAGCRRIPEIRLGGVKISVSPTMASTVNTQDTPPAMEEALFPRASSLHGHSRRFRSRTLLPLSPSFPCTPQQERS